eukprot:374023-Prymnesium_polylepis.2
MRLLCPRVICGVCCGRRRPRWRRDSDAAAHLLGRELQQHAGDLPRQLRELWLDHASGGGAASAPPTATVGGGGAMGGGAPTADFWSSGFDVQRAGGRGSALGDGALVNDPPAWRSSVWLPLSDGTFFNGTGPLLATGSFFFFSCSFCCGRTGTREQECQQPLPPLPNLAPQHAAGATQPQKRADLPCSSRWVGSFPWLRILCRVVAWTSTKNANEN